MVLDYINLNGTQPYARIEMVITGGMEKIIEVLQWHIRLSMDLLLSMVNKYNWREESKTTVTD